MSGLNPTSGSRRPPSLVSVGRMPIIAEDEAQNSQPTRPPHRRATSMPAYTTTNLRRPSSISNKGSANGRRTPPIPERSTARPTSSRGRPASFAGSSIYDSPFLQAHGIQVPPYPPPEYFPRASRDSNYRNPLRPAISGADQPDRNPPLKDEYSNMEKIKENPWVARRGGWRRICFIVAIIVILLVALAVGLALGLKDRNNSSSSGESTDDSPPVFPAGSFAFQTALTNVSTACTGDPATWRCYPYITYANATSPSTSTEPSDAAASFFWSILGPDDNNGRHGYAVSSADNPFAPRFSNVSMTMRDGNTQDERLEFSVEMNRTVVPDSSMAGFSDGVSCIFQSVFRGTVWTARMGPADRERANVTSHGSHQGKSRVWDPWPGEVEVIQVADSAPSCTNVRGDEIPVDSRNGECLCRYANYDLD